MKGVNESLVILNHLESVFSFNYLILIFRETETFLLFILLL